MTLFSVIALILGILYGMSGFEWSMIDFLAKHSNFILYILMFSVGISVGLHHGIWDKLREYHLKIFIIPMGIIIGSIMGGIVLSFFTGISLQESTAISSGLGWYSLSGIMITELANASVGSIAFLSNLMREIFSFFSIPWIAKHLNFLSCIAPAAATSEDTTLPMMIRYTNEETVVLSVLNGLICSALVPVLIRFCFQLF